ncbi:MAG: glycosyltransferase [Flavobacteriaceae bacterium]|nr:glycosyltransferase [Flavobacteriaceae bacterium]
MKISLISISYNSESTISKTFQSVKNQSFNNYEYLLIDGGSKDGTLNIAKKQDYISKIVSEPDKGIYDALNKGIKNSTGEIIGFLNSDDTFYDEDSLKHFVDAFDDDTDCVFGDLIYTDKNENIKRVWEGSAFKKGAFKKGWMPAHPTFYCRRSVYDKLGLYDDSFKIAGDFELMLRFLEKHKIRSKYIPKTLVNMKVGGASNNGLKSKLDILKEEFRAFDQNDISINKLSYIFNKAKKIKEFKF